MSAHTASLARTLGWMLLVVATLFGGLLFQDGHPSDAHGRWELAFVGGLYAAAILCIAGPQLVPLVVKLIQAWRAPTP